MPGKITEAMVRAATRGEPDALRAIYESLSPLVNGYLIAKGVPDAEAVTSDVFLAVLPRLSELRGGPAELRTFVMSIAHARMVDEHRRRARRPEWLPYEPEDDHRVVAPAEDTVISTVGLDEIVIALRRLPSEQSTVIALRFVADLSLDEVADITGRTVGAVKQLQRRGLLALRALLEASEVTP